MCRERCWTEDHCEFHYVANETNCKLFYTDPDTNPSTTSTKLIEMSEPELACTVFNSRND